jgi:serine/threonine protein kinase/Flp pilus assembly protein TadD
VNERDLFIAALQIEEPAARATYLDEACGGDEALRRRIEALLRAFVAAGSFMQVPAADAGATSDQPGAESPVLDSPTEAAGTVIGPYKLLQQIGEGGMGTVYMTEQTQPVQRRVALKIIKPGMDSRQVVARFEAERQALALMDHPHIARVLDAGTTEGGRPYFVMELVKGAPITRYCDEHRLTPRQRLELFVPVCQAVQHAHQKGVIHRDLKPSNVLVARYDGRPVPKVIDFGVAKATGPKLTERTPFTEFGQVVGTPEYMSPEQAELNQLDIDTRSDIYALGVLLYELLTGTTPLERKRLKATPLLEVLRVIREEEPPRPSTRLSTAEELPAIATNRGLEPKKLSRLVRGELDWIVMKCLEKDRGRRYETANGLARDLERYLHDEPVQACPPAAWYRFRKFARRNKPWLAVAGLVLFFLVLLGGGVGWAVRDRAARRATLEQQITRALEETRKSYHQGKLPEALAELKRAEGLLASGEGSEELGRRVRRWRTDLGLVQRLDRIRLEKGFSGRLAEVTPSGKKVGQYHWLPAKPGTRSAGGADQDHDYQVAFRSHGLDLDALDPEEAATRIRASAVQETLLAAIYDWLLNRWEATPQGGKKLLEVARRLEADPWRARFLDAFQRGDVNHLKAMARNQEIQVQPPQTGLLLGAVLFRAGEAALAVEVLRQAQRRHSGDFWLTYLVGEMLLRLKPPQPAEAVRFLQAALALRPADGRLHAQVGATLILLGQLTEAEAQCREAVRLQPDYDVAHNNLGCALKEQGKLTAAELAFRAAIRLRPASPTIHHNLCAVLEKQRKWPALEASYRERFRRLPGDAVDYDLFGLALYKQGKLSQAREAFREATRLNPDYSLAHHNLGVVLLDSGKPAEAEAALRHALRLKPDAKSHWNLGRALYEQRKLTDAETECRTAIRLHPDDHKAHYWHGWVLLAQRRFPEAEAAFRTSLRHRPDSANGHYSVGMALHHQGKTDDAVAEFREAIRLKPGLVEAYVNLGALLCDFKKDYEGAITALRTAIRLQPDHVAAHRNLSVALQKQGKLPEAEEMLRKLVRLKPNDAAAQFCLANALLRQKKLGEAVAAYQKVLALTPGDAEAHCNLGHALRDQGRFADALVELKKGHELGSRRPDWSYPSARWVASCERLLELDGRLPGILKGEARARDWNEQFEFARLCGLKRLSVAAARLYQEGLSTRPVRTAFRFSAGCAAVLAGCGKGKDAASLDARDRARWRQQGLEWLRADLGIRRRRLEAGSSQERKAVQRTLEFWKGNADLAGVRDRAALTQLPPAEREAWQQFWADVEALLRQARQGQQRQ